MKFLDDVRDIVRKLMGVVAKLLNNAAGGRLSPNAVTITGLVAHLPIAWLIASRQLGWAALLLVVFGLFDTLDGELARLQDRATPAGMLLDASTDRFKEVLLYSGLAYYLVAVKQPYNTVWAVIALGGSLCVSYVKAKGETAVNSGELTMRQVNRMFEDGLMRFEVRMFILFLGLFTSHVLLAVVIIAVGSTLTALDRLVRISQKL